MKRSGHLANTGRWTLGISGYVFLNAVVTVELPASVGYYHSTIYRPISGTLCESLRGQVLYHDGSGSNSGHTRIGHF
jgi:hypothetical protein